MLCSGSGSARIPINLGSRIGRTDPDPDPEAKKLTKFNPFLHWSWSLTTRKCFFFYVNIFIKNYLHIYSIFLLTIIRCPFDGKAWIRIQIQPPKVELSGPPTLAEIEKSIAQLKRGTAQGKNNPCHVFSVIAGVVDTGDKIYHRCGEQLSPLTMTPGINLFIAGVVVTGEKFIAGDKNKDAIEVGSCQG